MELLFYGFFFLLAFGSLYFLTKAFQKGEQGAWQRYVEWFVHSTDYLFLPLSDSAARKIIATSIIVFGTIGFFFPGQLARLDHYSIDSAIELNRQGKHQDALDILMDYFDSDSPLIHNEIGLSYLGSGGFDEAIVQFQAAVKILPEYIPPHANLAVAYSFLGLEQDAAFELRKAKSLAKFSVSEELIYGMDEGLLGNINLRIFSFLIFGMVGWFLPKMVIKRMMAKRMRQFDELLPEGLIMATNGLRAGMSLGQVLENLSQEAPKPLNQEFGLVVKEQRLGKEFNETLRGLAKRMPTDDTNILVNSIVILREVGGNLTEVFENLAYTIRERKMIKEKISTMTAEGRSQAVILVILPFVLGWLLDKMSPEVFSLMYTTPLGWMIIIFMVLWGGIGCVAMWKIVQVKV